LQIIILISSGRTGKEKNQTIIPEFFSQPLTLALIWSRISLNFSIFSSGLPLKEAGSLKGQCNLSLIPGNLGQRSSALLQTVIK